MTEPETPATQHQKAEFKHPDNMCECIKWMEKEEIIRFGESIDRSTGDMGIMPVIDPNRRRKNAAYAIIKFCPNCGQPTFDLIPTSPDSTVEQGKENTDE